MQVRYGLPSRQSGALRLRIGHEVSGLRVRPVQGATGCPHRAHRRAGRDLRSHGGPGGSSMHVQSRDEAEAGPHRSPGPRPRPSGSRRAVRRSGSRVSPCAEGAHEGAVRPRGRGSVLHTRPGCGGEAVRFGHGDPRRGRGRIRGHGGDPWRGYAGGGVPGADVR